MSQQLPPAASLTFPSVTRDSLVEAHQGYVRALALEIMRGLPAKIELDELIGYGHIGLVEAAERFDPKRGASFTTFAYYRIRGAIFDGLREMGYLSRSAYDSQRARFAARATDLMQTAADDASAHTALSTNIEDDIIAIRNLIDELIPAYLLSMSSEMILEIPDSQPSDALRTEQSELCRFAIEAMRALPDDDRQLLEALYVKHTNAKDYAEQVGLSKPWVSRLHTRAIKRLRLKLVERGLLIPDNVLSDDVLSND